VAANVLAHDSGVELREQLGEIDVWILDDPIKLAVRSRDISIKTAGYLISKSAHVPIMGLPALGTDKWRQSLSGHLCQKCRVSGQASPAPRHSRQRQ
jgi:hypothetical protein